MGTDASGQGPNHSTLADTPLVVARQIDQICDRFESALGRGDRPTLAEFLDQLPAEATSATRRTLLHELIRIDLEYGWRSAHQLGQTATWHGKNRTTVSDASTHHAKQRFDHGPYVEDYLDRFRDLGSREHVPPELVRAEYRARCRWGDRPSHDEYFERFAGLASLKTALAEVDEELQLSMDSVQPQGVTNFDDFDIIAEISRGGMGVVYKARQRSLNRIVAVKMILTGAQASEQEVTRFRREAEGAAALDHVGIVPIYQIGEHDGNHYFSMAYIDGPSLARHLDNGPLPIKDAAQLMLKLARALHYAHQRGVVHRDLKPANVLIDNNGEPKVTDFGLAKLVDQARRDTRLTTTGQILGTPSFMAPEQAAGQSESATHLADVYALGAIFYHVLTGRPPFQAHTAIETLKQVMTNEPVSPALLNARIPRDAATICLKCLEKNPARRYASANDLAEELERLLDGAPIKARPVSNVEKLWRWMRRNPWRARVAGLLIVLAAVVPLLAFIAIYDYIRRAPLEEQNRQAKQHFDREVASLQQRNYVAEMNLLESAWNSGDLRRAYELLQAQRPIRGTSDPRGFEWFLRWRMYHHQPLRIQPVQKWNGLDPWCCAVEDNAVLLWDSAADRVLFSAQGHAHWVTAIAVSPDGETMATGGRDAAVILWDLATSAERARITAHRGGIVAMAFAPDGRQIATAANDHTVCLSDLTRSPPTVTRLQIDPSAASTHRATVWSVAYSPDGSLLASASHDRTIAIWNPRTKQLINVLEGHELGIRAVAFAPNLRWLVSAGDDGTIRQWPLWKPGSPRTLPEFGKANHRWRALDVSQDASVLAAGDNNGFIVLWDLASREIRRQWKPHHRAVVKLFFSPDDSRLVSTSSDGTAAIVDIVDGQVSPLEVPQRTLSAIPRMMRPKVELASPIGRINDLAFSHDSTVLIGAGVANDKEQGDDEFVAGGHVTLWRVSNSPEVTSTLHQAHEITSLAVSARGMVRFTSCRSIQGISWRASLDTRIV